MVYICRVGCHSRTTLCFLRLYQLTSGSVSGTLIIFIPLRSGLISLDFSHSFQLQAAPIAQTSLSFIHSNYPILTSQFRLRRSLETRVPRTWWKTET